MAKKEKIGRRGNQGRYYYYERMSEYKDNSSVHFIIILG